MCVCVRARARVRVDIHVLIFIHTHTHTHTHAMYGNKCMHTQIHTYILIHAHKYTCTYITITTYNNNSTKKNTSIREKKTLKYAHTRQAFVPNDSHTSTKKKNYPD